jgi:hypothetical protein
MLALVPTGTEAVDFDAELTKLLAA